MRDDQFIRAAQEVFVKTSKIAMRYRDLDVLVAVTDGGNCASALVAGAMTDEAQGRKAIATIVADLMVHHPWLMQEVDAAFCERERDLARDTVLRMSDGIRLVVEELEEARAALDAIREYGRIRLANLEAERARDPSDESEAGDREAEELALDHLRDAAERLARK